MRINNIEEIQRSLPRGVWPVGYTTEDKYQRFNAKILESLKRRRRKDITLVDVGCSTGKATDNLKQLLELHGYVVRAIGIDYNSISLKDIVPEELIFQFKLLVICCLCMLELQMLLFVMVYCPIYLLNFEQRLLKNLDEF